jgi:hypothetical protein
VKVEVLVVPGCPNEVAAAGLVRGMLDDLSHLSHRRRAAWRARCHRPACRPRRRRRPQVPKEPAASDRPATDPIETGLLAWQGGDLNALEAVLAPDVSLRAARPGPWDCYGRDDVMRLLRRRAAERGDRAPTAVHVQRVDEHTYLLHADEPGPEPFPAATRITVAGGRVEAMQQMS